MKSISRPAISGTYSCWVLNSSPIAIGIARLLPDQLEVVLLLGRQRVLEEERAVLLQLLAQLHGLAGRDPLVDVVQQLDLVAELRAQVLEQLRHGAGRRGRAPRRSWDRSARRTSRLVGSLVEPGAVGRPCRGSPPGRGRAGTPSPSPPGRSSSTSWMSRPLAWAYSRRGEPALAAQQLIDGHVRPLALDVPERHVHAAHRVEQHRAVPPVRADVGRLPDVLDLVDVAADRGTASGTCRRPSARRGRAG